MTAKPIAAGLDFGTSNSSVAVVRADGSIELARFPASAPATGESETMRSVLFFPADTEERERTAYVGAEAVARYLDSGAAGRFVQSLKSFLADRSFRSTTIMGDSFSLEDLLAPMARALRTAAKEQFGELPDNVVVGRPVRFAGSDDEADERLALDRLEIGLRRGGWHNFRFEYEPVAAACHYGAQISREETVLVGDFGGGTSDFSLVRIIPAEQGHSAQPRYEILGNEGVALAGDAFDGRIVRHLVAPELGRGSSDGITCRC